MLDEGKKAPAFTLEDKDGEKVRLNGIESDYTIVYFYPKDNTPGCTTEAKEFSKDLGKFKKIGAEIIGISGGDNSTKEKFCGKHKLKVTLLSDPDFKVSDKYGVFGEKQFMGKKFKGIHRATFVLDKNKKVLKCYPKVKAAGHSKEVLDYLKSLK